MPYFSSQEDLIDVDSAPQEVSYVQEIRTLLAEKLYTEVASPDADLLREGHLDSVVLVQLLMEVEERFGIHLPIEELEIDDFRSVRSIAHLVANRRQRLMLEGDPSV